LGDGVVSELVVELIDPVGSDASWLADLDGFTDSSFDGVCNELLSTLPLALGMGCRVEDAEAEGWRIELKRSEERRRPVGFWSLIRIFDF
jgi:hypothetical protein